MIDVVGVHHLGMTVGDLDASCRWARDAGYGPPERLSITGPDGAEGNGLESAALEIAFVSATELTLEMVEFRPADLEVVQDFEPSFGSVPAWTDGVASHDPDGHPVTSGSVPCALRFTSARVEQTMQLLDLLGFDRVGDGDVSGHGLRIEIVAALSGRVVPANAPGRLHLCCQVRDMAAACAELERRGYGLVSTPRVQEGLAWVFVAHPGGPGIELLEIS
jgi:catechol 2,3-dioxygenase-like lactoylglutathione lyase family enzyme